MTQTHKKTARRLITGAAVLLLLLLICGAGAAAAAAADQKTGIAPSLTLNITGAPAGLFEDAKVTLTTTENLSADTLTLLRGITDRRITNAAYETAVNITGLNTTGLTDCTILLPVPLNWSEANTGIQAVIVTGTNAQLAGIAQVNATQNGTALYSLTLSSVPDKIILAATADKAEETKTTVPTYTQTTLPTTTPTPAPTQTPAPALALIAALAGAALLVRKNT